MNQYKSNTLFVLKKASVGGPTASLINLLSLYSEKGIIFDVFLMDHNGANTDKLRQYCNLLPPISELSDSIVEKNNIKTLAQFYHRFKFIISCKLYGINKTRYNLYQKSVRHLNGKYTNVIAYQESETTDFTRFIDAPNKISWLHTDFEKLRTISPRYATKQIYNNFQNIASVTEASAKSLAKHLERDESDIHVIRNTLCEKDIVLRSEEQIPANEKKKKQFLFLSVGRFNPEKGFDRIPRVAKALADAGVSFDWYIIGDGIAKDSVREDIDNMGVSDMVHILGTRLNPYPYMRIADCLVITSKHEAQPMVANEALTLGIPVITTDFRSAREVVHDGIDGLIVPNTVEGLVEGVIRFVESEGLRSKLRQGAEDFSYDNESVLDKVSQILEMKG